MLSHESETDFQIDCHLSHQLIIEVSVGEWRSLVARFVRDEEVPGSNPGSPTISPGLFGAPVSPLAVAQPPLGVSYRSTS